MPDRSSFDRRSRRAPLVALALATVVTNAVVADVALASSPTGRLPAQVDPSCPAAFPVRRLREGQVLNGLTVDRGTTPAPFTATVIGVLDDGIAPGLDMILAEASSPAIDRAHGIWAGMSGSPVYAADGRLVGSVSYGLTFGASPIAGITPAAEMRKLLSGGSAAAAPGETDLTAALENQIVASGAATVQEAASGLTRLPVPVAVSGANPARLRRVTRLVRRTLDGVRVYASSSAAAQPAALALVPGGNVAAALSYGSLTAAGVGTVTAVCADEALLFGHPFSWSGATTLSAHAATAVTVQPGGDISAGFKVANLGGVVGTVDQDRLAGLHTIIGTPPASTFVRSAFAAAGGGTARIARTRAVLPEFVSTAAALHVLNNLDRVHDRIGPGVVTLRWGASGRRSNGTPWHFRRREKMADQFDATFPPAFKVLVDLDTLFNNPFTPITIDKVFLRGTVDPAYAEARLVRVEKRGPNGRWQTLSRRTPLTLVAGREVLLRGVLRSVRSSRLARVPLSFVAPARAGSTGTLSVSGGASFGVEGRVRNFSQLLAAVDSAPTGDTLRAQLTVSRPTPAGRETTTRRARATAPTALFGRFAFRVVVVPAVA